VILQALCEYYQRKAADSDSKIAPQGFEWKEIPFVVVINRNGKFLRLEDTREGEGNWKRAKPFLVPQAIQRSGSKSWQTSFLLWDHYGYVLGRPKEDTEQAKDRAQKQHQSWLKKLRQLPSELKESTSVGGVLKFYDDGQDKEVIKDALWEECLKIPGCNLTFRLEGEAEPVPCSEEVQKYVRSGISSDGTDTEDSEGTERIMRCLITGELGPAARLHTKTPISKDSKALVSFQKASGFDSYGKEQGFNAPVSIIAESAYTTALNTLLSKDSPNKLQVGDATAVFWSKKETQLEVMLPFFFDRIPPDNPDQDIQAVRSLYQGIEKGAFSDSTDTEFYVLGLSPNAARISVRFWHTGKVSEFAQRIKAHFDDFKIMRPPFEQRCALFYLLCDIAQQGKAENIPPNLAGEVMRAILEGQPYPAQILQQTVRRIRATQMVNSYRAAWLKAYLNRKYRMSQHPSLREITVALDKENKDIGYRLGRLFAALEKIQEGAQSGINATIRDRFYGAASTSPVAVFSQLLKLKNHHLAKQENPAFRVAHEKRLAEIFEPIKEFPPHLSMEQQAQFAIGYYHQRQDFFKKKNNGESTSKEA